MVDVPYMICFVPWITYMEEIRGSMKKINKHVMSLHPHTTTKRFKPVFGGILKSEGLVLGSLRLGQPNSIEMDCAFSNTYER